MVENMMIKDDFIYVFLSNVNELDWFLDICCNVFKVYGELDLFFVDKIKIICWNFIKFEMFIFFKEGVMNEILLEKVVNLVDLDNKEVNFYV